MSMTSSPPIGATAYGVSGQVCTVAEVEGDRVILTSPDGSVKRAPLSAIVRWELPPPTEVPPQEFQLGDHVRYLGGGWLGSQMRPLISGKTLVVKSLQHTPTEGIWVTCHVPGGLAQTIPASNLKHFY
jgi:hypothetical protein